ncbi:recombinase family protein [Hymenobacter arizonensis]|uniref:Site-specific DNA recombinase n=1 Tax=Hymenobacter arizonensis TaxID=1227077 RepID=A0A1I6BFD6_HYMAR|nr:recombinase family protein [Hymenobacter arizonensis]SFQ79487.1 Site-specific DNA recombinase [Hymenobacter arizonensis]
MTPTAPAKRYTPYYRVSTQKQGASGLGLEAQQAAVRTFVADPSQLLGEFIEVESGKQNQRPQLLAAMAEARRVGSTLLIAKLDRLSRNAGFIFALRDSGVDFVCCDMPDANTLTVGLFAVIAQHERETISKRTKDALAAKKARGATLGTPANLTDAARQQSLLVRRAQVQQHPGLRQAAAFISSRRAQGVSFRQLAGELNALGFTAPRGGTFNQKQVQRLYERLPTANKNSVSG